MTTQDEIKLTPQQIEEIRRDVEFVYQQLRTRGYYRDGLTPEWAGSLSETLRRVRDKLR